MSVTTKLILSLSVKSIRAPESLYNDMLESSNIVFSITDGNLYFGKYLVVLDKSLSGIDLDFNYKVIAD